MLLNNIGAGSVLPLQWHSRRVDAGEGCVRALMGGSGGSSAFGPRHQFAEHNHPWSKRLSLRGGGRYRSSEERTKGITGAESRSGAGGSGLKPQDFGKGKKRKRKIDAGPTDDQIRAAEKKEGLEAMGRKEMGKNSWKEHVANKQGRRVLASDSESDGDEPAPVRVDVSKLPPIDRESKVGRDGDDEGSGLEGMDDIGPVEFQYDQDEAEV